MKPSIQEKITEINKLCKDPEHRKLIDRCLAKLDKTSAFSIGDIEQDKEGIIDFEGTWDNLE